MNWIPEPPSEYLSHIIELADFIDAGYHPNLPAEEWRALSILKRKRNEAQIKEIKQKK